MLEKEAGITGPFKKNPKGGKYFGPSDSSIYFPHSVSKKTEYESKSWGKDFSGMNLTIDEIRKKRRKRTRARKNPDVTFTRDKLRKLILVYNKAMKEGKTEFTFEGNQYLVAYAKYLIEYLQTQFGVDRFNRNPGKKSISKPNPRSNLRDGVVIYDKLIEIKAEKGNHSNFPGEKYYHPFKGNTAAKVIGMPDGSLRIVSTKGKMLWKNFDYPDNTR